MNKSLFGLLALLENFIYSPREKKEKDVIKAKKLHSRLLGNYGLTESQIKWVNNLYNL